MSREIEVSPSAWVIRPGSLDDVDDLAALEALAFEGEPFQISRRQWRYLAGRNGGALLVAEEAGGRLAGALVLTARSGGRIARIYSVAVHPSARRQGMAKRLIEAAASVARESGYEALQLEVRATNDPALQLYRSLGFGDETKLPSYYGLGEHGLRLSRELADREKTFGVSV